MRHILTEISPKFKLRIKFVLKRFVKRAPDILITLAGSGYDDKIISTIFLDGFPDVLAIASKIRLSYRN